MRLIYGTGNPAKLSAMQIRLSGFDLEIIGLKDLNIEIPEVRETGSSPLENAYQKRKHIINYLRNLFFHVIQDYTLIRYRMKSSQEYM
nr:non-canonical purine NTP pyrophosphatase [uncultured Clostridium sp.]